MDQPATGWSTADLTANLDANLNELCAIAERSLADTWDEIGTPREVRAQAAAALKSQLTHCFLAALQKETGAHARDLWVSLRGHAHHSARVSPPPPFSMPRDAIAPRR